MSKSMSIPKPSSTVTAPFSMVRTVAMVGVEAMEPRWFGGDTTAISSSASGKGSSSGASVGGVEELEELVDFEAVGEDEDEDEADVEVFAVVVVVVVAVEVTTATAEVRLGI